jgi:oligo-alginate lyase
MSSQSIFFNDSIREILQTNTTAVSDQIDHARWWLDKSYDELAALMFGPTIKRSWMVLSYGSCPTCSGEVPMYDWKIDAVNKPWKLECPHCGELFPKNDFEAFYRSGLDDEGYFRRDQADESLLVGPDSPFGVDDGEGFVNEQGNLRFIGTYLIYGQWMQLVMGGVKALSFAYLLTGEREYARRTAVLLYRIARFFPEFDFRSQGVMYEKLLTSRGYVTYWASTPVDLIDMAIAYDMVIDAISDDDSLERITGVTCDELQRYIRKRIFEEALPNRERFESNPPYTDVAILVLRVVLGELDRREQLFSEIEGIIREYTQVDGLSGEKGLYGYAAIAPAQIADLLLLFSNVDAQILPEMLARIPDLRKTYRFHLDTWYMERYYPGVGDAGSFGGKSTEYVATLRSLVRCNTYLRSKDWFTYHLYEVFDDPGFAQALVHTRGNIESCFCDDLYLPDPSLIRRNLKHTIDKYGMEIDQSSVLYDQWRIAVLHSGKNEHRRMLCMNYDSGANHSHEDALNIGFFFQGKNMLPDFGYPPVHHGGWDTKEFHWYRRPVSHNLVVVDGRDHEKLAEGRFIRRPKYGAATLSGARTWFQIAHADAKEYAGIDRYERTIALVDIDQTRCYCLDLFRVSGGEDHTMFLRTPLATVVTEGISTDDGGEYGHDTFMRNFRTDPAPSANWTIRFSFNELGDIGAETGIKHGVKYHALTADARVTLCESWVDVTRGIGIARSDEGRVMWIPTLMQRRSGPDSLFAGIIEPFSPAPSIQKVMREDIGEDAFSIQVRLDDDTTDWIIVRNPKRADQEGISYNNFETDASLAAIRINRNAVVHASQFGGTFLSYRGKNLDS